MQPIQPTDSDNGWGEVPAIGGDPATVVPDPVTGVSPVQVQQSVTQATQQIAQAKTVPPVPAYVLNQLDPSGSLVMYFQSINRRIGGYSDIPWEDLYLMGDGSGSAAQKVDTDPFDAPRVVVPVDVDPFDTTRAVRVPDEDPFAGIVYPPKTYKVFGKSGTTHSTGLVPDPGASAGTAKFLCEDATWKTAGMSTTVLTYPASEAIFAAGGYAENAGDLTTGTMFTVSTAMNCAGVRFYGFTGRTYTCRLWNAAGTNIASVFGVAGATGYINGSFGAVALTPFARYYVTIHEASASFYNQGATVPAPLIGSGAWLANPYVTVRPQFYSSGDTFPSAVSGGWFAVDPILS